MKDHKITSIEISFGAAVTLPDGWERALDGLIGMVCEQYQRENPTRVMWPAGAGSKPRWSQRDAAFLGVAAASDAPADGDPTFDDSVYFLRGASCVALVVAWVKEDAALFSDEFLVGHVDLLGSILCGCHKAIVVDVL